jgi:signal transduction histidine kinase
MNATQNRFSKRYLAALRKHLKDGPSASFQSANALGRLALAGGLQTFDLALMQRQALAALTTPGRPSGNGAGVIRRAEAFFVEAIRPIEQSNRVTTDSNIQLNQLSQTFRRRTVELAAANRELKREIIRRQSVEENLKKSELHSAELLKESRLMQEPLRHLARQVLLAQEEERKEISRELHDGIAQTLTAINIHLATLTRGVTVNTKGLKKKIVRTQKLVEKSVNNVHRFARDLRPTLLDDLGLIPALHAYLKDFTQRTKVHVQFAASAGVERLGSARRTVLYRIAQSALTNIAQHARATQVKMSIQQVANAVRMEINDNGKSFDVERVLCAKRHQRLGLLGMRERVEMFGGSFSVASTPNQGTTICARLPFAKASGRTPADSRCRHFHRL